jgi:squalene synthase HpnC
MRAMSSAFAPAPPGALPSRGAVMAQAASENFTVASAVLGRPCRRHLMAIYGFARLVDDTGDEAAGDRGALLDAIEAELDRIYRGGEVAHPVMAALAPTVRECRLSDAPFRRLIEANRLDQVKARYETYGELLDYCRLSANPVGELVLGVFGAATPDRVALSDSICTGLQIVEHLQDIAEDFARGRVYVPREDLVRFGCDDRDLSGEPTSARRALIAFEAARARALMGAGAPLARTLSWRPRLAVAGFVAGGRAALNALEGGQRGFARAAWRAVMGR